MKTISLEQIKAVVPSIDLISDIEEGFVAYSLGQANVPPVGELILEKGEVHIKYGCLINDEYYVIKIASGFYDNPTIGLPSGNGLMVLFRQDTGQLVCILLDEGHLTDIRTAVAGAIAAKHLAPKNVERIGVVGTGVQARLQLSYLKDVTTCRRVLAWGRSEEPLERYRRDMEANDFAIETTRDTGEILRTCNLIVTVTPATEPLLLASELQSGTHITAVGSDTPHKQELETAILREADVVVADSIAQCLLRGEIFKAMQSGDITQDELIELGDIIAGRKTGRASDSQITVADLTGVAVQDIKIAAAVYEALA
ncbi:MAG: ornithine cyclodeaminase family protein [Candidatus Latescibacteria bacterium]|nr:ornithine cyclodeaminase family protein [Candidatus Latescibacterota bacterium]NIO56296.1 ornithine cyclodeaminase family protein [Candidatus Latescibacterota bacterium]